MSISFIRSHFGSMLCRQSCYLRWRDLGATHEEAMAEARGGRMNSVAPEECCICHENIARGTSLPMDERQFALDCGHAFHRLCIRRSLKVAVANRKEGEKRGDDGFPLACPKCKRDATCHAMSFASEASDDETALAAVGGRHETAVAEAAPEMAAATPSAIVPTCAKETDGQGGRSIISRRLASQYRKEIHQRFYWKYQGIDKDKLQVSLSEEQITEKQSQLDMYDDHLCQYGDQAGQHRKKQRTRKSVCKCRRTAQALTMRFRRHARMHLLR
jgi:hypothetical protein